MDYYGTILPIAYWYAQGVRKIYGPRWNVPINSTGMWTVAVTPASGRFSLLVCTAIRLNGHGPHDKDSGWGSSYPRSVQQLLKSHRRSTRILDHFSWRNVHQRYLPFHPIVLTPSAFGSTPGAWTQFVGRS